MPVVTALQSRIAELSDELRHQGSALAAAQKEKARLTKVEADLGRTIQSLRFELTALQKTHSDELLAVSTENDNLRAERDAAMTAQTAMRAEPAPLEMASARTVTSTLPSMKSWIWKLPDCAVGPKPIATPWRRWTHC